LSFWGSYLGGGLTIVAIIVTLYINKRNVAREIKKEAILLKDELEKERARNKKETALIRLELEKERIKINFNELLHDIDSLCESMTSFEMNIYKITDVNSRNTMLSYYRKVGLMLARLQIFLHKYSESTILPSDFFDFAKDIEQKIIDLMPHKMNGESIIEKANKTLDGFCELWGGYVVVLLEKVEQCKQSIRNTKNAQIERMHKSIECL